MKSKIVKSEFKKKWGEGSRLTYFHDVWLEGESKPFNIGTKTEVAPFLAVGLELEYDIVDSEKRKIKRAKANTGYKPGMGGSAYKQPFKNFAPQPTINPDSKALIRVLDNYDESDIVFLDIETASGVQELKPNTPLHDAWLYKTRYSNELERKSGEEITPEEYFKSKAALYAPFAKIVCIVVGKIVEEQLVTKRYVGTEKEILTNFNEDMKKIIEKKPKTVFAGWASKGFDQPFINKRMIVHGIQPILLLDSGGLKPWELRALDLKELWQGTAFYPDSLISVAVTMGLKSPKTKMDGSQVGEYFYAGKINEIAEYCEQDVLTTANIYRKFRALPIVSLKG